MLKTFSFFCQDQDQDQDFYPKTKTLGLKTRTYVFVPEAPWDQDLGLKDYITAKLVSCLKILKQTKKYQSFMSCALAHIINSFIPSLMSV